MEILRTPDERFGTLAEYPFEPHYAQLGELRMHYVDAGPRDGSPVLMLHGEPSWSYLYRKMIPPFAAAGYRALAPDLIGFGKSDKPSATSDYSYQAHVDWLVAWIEQLDLRNVTLICQDWGSMLGLRIAAEHGERFARIVVANGYLPIARRPGALYPTPMIVKIWRAFAIPYTRPGFQSAGSSLQAVSPNSRRPRSPLMTHLIRTAATRPVRGRFRA